MNQEAPSGSEPTGQEPATRWLSQGFETLVASLEADPQQSARGVVDFDVVIVGTGYGGAVAAAELAKTRGDRRIAVLERGNEHLPGSFPSRMSELAGHVRFSTKEAHHARGRRDALFDVRIGEDLSAVVGNGVGGGSLINAGVMAMPPKAVFASPTWPAAFRDAATADALLELGETLRQRLGATQTVKSVDHPEPIKYQALGKFHGGAKTQPLPITVALTDAAQKTFATAAGVRIDSCIRCGDCATGCNYNAKISLDVTLLAEARQHGAELFTGATVLKIDKTLDAQRVPVWHLHVVPTDEPLRRRHGTATIVRARRVVLAAGTFGSTEILLRSQDNSFRLSHKLGHQVSSNGDLIAAAYAGNEAANCAGDEDADPRRVPAAERVGPTITGMVDLRDTDGMVIQDLAVPGPLRSLLEQGVTTAAAIHMLGEADERQHGPQTRDLCAVDDEAIRNTLLVAIIGHDSADGVMKLNPGTGWDSGDGAATIVWPQLRNHPPLLARHRRFEELLQASGARALPNPMWQLLPEKLNYLLGGETGPLLTVHPLGGCPMGDDVGTGVVDGCGRVFDASRDANGRPHDGLVVLDGSIVPASLGINPALTIATLTLRAIGKLRDEWGYAAHTARDEIGNRPRFKMPEAPRPPQDTQIEVLERLSGPVALFGIEGPNNAAAHVELTMRFDPIAIRDLTSGTAAATLQLQASHGRLRIFSERPPDDREARDESAVLVATVKGTLRAFSHKKTFPLARRLQGLWAWVRNRGLRDSVLWIMDRWNGEAPTPGSDNGFLKEAFERSKSLWALSSRAGAGRLLEYDLQVDGVLTSKDLPEWVLRSFFGAEIKGQKELTYSRRSNPWRQLMEVSLSAFPRARRRGAVLELDQGYLARQRVPLFRIVQQQDHAKALADVASLGLYLTRILFHIHAWSFRLPDEAQARDVQRLPGYVPGLPEPEIHEFVVGRPRNGQPVMVRLTHYPYSEEKRKRMIGKTPSAKEAILAPILLIHGYSASGTTFAHHSVQPNVASSLWERGRDVWIADLRTSAGMPHAKEPWTFEQVGMADIPMAVHQVCALTGAAKIDVFAHCMGSAMLGMALLGSESKPEPFLELRRELPDRIRRLVMSQVAPAVVFTPANTFRAYAMQYLRHFLPLHDYEFRPSGKRSRTDMVMDRLLASLPYPEAEFDLENPIWPPWRRTPWVGTRHRMDALYGRDFNVRNVSKKMLDFIDDHFGPLSIETVSQAVHFARLRAITTREGFNDFVRPDRLSDKFRFPVMHVHGRQNGLASNRTPARFRKVLTDSDSKFRSDRAFLPLMYEAGHQDLLIGTPAADMFRDMNAYLEAPFDAMVGDPAEFSITFAARIPAYGVRVPPPFADHDRCSLGDEGASGAPVAALVLPVVKRGDGYLPVDAAGQPVEPTPGYLREVVEWRALTPVSRGNLATRYTFKLDDYEPPQGACGVLILVLYNQSAALQPGAGRSNSELASSVAGLPSRGNGLAVLAGMAVASKVLYLPDIGGSAELIDKIVHEMARSVQHTLRRVNPIELGLGILRHPKKRDPSQPPPSTTSFALASCQYPGDILDRTPVGTPPDCPAGPSDASYLRLASLLEGTRADGHTGEPLPVPEFLVLAGDQIYADATAGLFDARRLDDRYRVSYEAFLGAPGPRAVLSRLPAVMRLDDHEIGDNWEPDPSGAFDGQRMESLKEMGVQEFFRNQRDQEFDPAKPLWEQTPVAGFAFFWADARTARASRTESTVARASMLGKAQADALDQWMADKSASGPRFLVSAPMVLPRHLQMRRASAATALRSDAWDGFPASLHRLLASVYQRGRDDVVFLSGDAHVSNVARIEISKVGAPGLVVAHSIHSSALYAPYPFANGIEADFANDDVFEFSQGEARYRCTVRTWSPSRGDGFAVLSVSADDAGWRVDVRFDREQGSPYDPANRFEFRIGGPAATGTGEGP